MSYSNPIVNQNLNSAEDLLNTRVEQAVLVRDNYLKDLGLI